jgi:hypothetical protein
MNEDNKSLTDISRLYRGVELRKGTQIQGFRSALWHLSVLRSSVTLRIGSDSVDRFSDFLEPGGSGSASNEEAKIGELHLPAGEFNDDRAEDKSISEGWTNQFHSLKIARGIMPPVQIWTFWLVYKSHELKKMLSARIIYFRQSESLEFLFQILMDPCSPCALLSGVMFHQWWWVARWPQTNHCNYHDRTGNCHMSTFVYSIPFGRWYEAHSPVRAEYHTMVVRKVNCSLGFRYFIYVLARRHSTLEAES